MAGYSLARVPSRPGPGRWHRGANQKEGGLRQHGGATGGTMDGR